MFPYRDELQPLRRPHVTLALIAANVLVWLFVQGAGAGQPLLQSVCDLGLIPGELTGTVPPGTSFPLGEGYACVTQAGRHASHLLTSMFLHGSWVHLLGNMWFLWIFGKNVEDAMTRPRFLAFYMLSGLTAAFAQVAAGPSSGVPMVGASGAIAGVMGAYLVKFPHSRILSLVTIIFFFTTVEVPA
ncbi:MAG TPA: rhomboid family intramembrane serine protease, partial [Candidatus Methylomirabilis sp.]|nr:rhomboid family intramembrane serine protease [Candidatus Methylomirabilis sp.]